MRRSVEYQQLPPRSKAFVELLIVAVVDDGLVNGAIALTVAQLMAAIGIRSRRLFDKAI